MKADLHVHSKFSDRPTEWFLRRIGAPECFTEPADIYRLGRERGMDFITITDHNRIDGALAIAHLPATFVSAELTTYFPEDGCKVHCLALGITESQFAALQTIRENIYDLRRYLSEQNIAHVIAHPLFSVNETLNATHVEKLLLLFDRFEAVNGARHPRAGNLATAIFSHLTPALIDEMANRHNLKPWGPELWIKRFTGGSDDHSGIYIASAYAVTPAAAAADEFLAHIRAGNVEPGGTAGTSLRLAHSLYHIAYSYYRNRFMRAGSGTSVIGELLRRLMEGSALRPQQRPRRLWSLGERLVRRYRTRRMNRTECLLIEEFSRLRERAQTETARFPGAPAGKSREIESFETACRISHELSYAFFKQFLNDVEEGRLIDGLQTVATLGTIVLGVAPYLTAFGAQHKDERFLRELAARFEAGKPLQQRSDRRAWVTDTYSDVNGVAQTIQTLSSLAQKRGRPITVITSLENPPNEPGMDVTNFKPLGLFSMPEYESQKLAFPPFLDVVEYLERGNFNEVILSTPGPLGLTGLMAARLLGLEITGIYHTDFPQYVKCLTQDEMLEQMTWRYMHWFYGQMRKIYVPSEYYRRHLAANGFDAAALQVLPRGVDMTRFNPAKRDPAFWSRFGLNGAFKILYVGRVSREKNVHLLVDAYQNVRATRQDVDLVIVGEGPELTELKQKMATPNIVFTGFLKGEALARAYASADLFVFPSTSDTFGNVVLEAQASGLPAVVSTLGGPAEIVNRNGSGLAVDVRQPAALCEAIHELIQDEPRRREMGRRALQAASAHDWERVLEQF